MMIVEQHTPSAALRPFIKAYQIIESEEVLLNRVVPNTSFALAFRFKGKISYLSETDKNTLPLATFSGLRKSVRLINYAAGSGALIIQFTETGVPAFFRHPLQELFEETVSLEHFFDSKEIAIVEEQLAEAENNAIRIAIIERFLCSRLLSPKSDRLVTEAIIRIKNTGGIMRIRELAESLCISQDAFEKRFRKIVGASPKQFSTIVKLKEIVAQKPPVLSLVDLALEKGFYDQAHFNKDFKIFTGQTPAEFFKAPAFW